MRKRIIMPLGERMASVKIVVKLMASGALQVGENGLCTGDPGIYKIEEIPTQTANPSGDE